MDEVAAFQAATGAGRVEADFWLAYAEGNVARAIQQYQAARARETDGSGPTSSVPGSSVALPSQHSSRSGNSKNTRRGPRVATLADLGGSDYKSNPATDENRLFAGGEKSALAVQGPGGGPKRPGADRMQLVNRIVQKAMRGSEHPEEAGFENTEDYAAAVAANSQPARAPTFDSSSGFRLGRENDTEQESIPASTTPAAALAPAELENVTRTLIFWRNGFSVDDGELFSYDNPQNERYLNLIDSGRAPLELLNVKPDQLVSVQVMERHDQDYIAPRREPGFTGQGARLGTSAGPLSPSPGAAPEKSSEPAPLKPTSSTPQITGEGDVTVQVKLSTGSVLRIKVDSNGSVQQLYNEVDKVNAGDREYVLQTTYPMRRLTDHDETIAAAKLAGSTVVQRFV